MSKRQNVLFIVLDQLRADLVSGDLASHVKLPNIRALMDDAVTFTKHYSVTNPCGPSRVSILTGQYAMSHRSVRNGTPARHDTPNIATQMRKSGYMPLLFGYTDTAQDPRVYAPADPALTTYEFPMSGFREIIEMRFEESYPWRADLVAKGYTIPDYADFFVPDTPKGQVPRIDDPAFYRAKDSDTAFLTDAFLADYAVRKEQAWFRHLTYIRPHPPLVAPAPYNTMYDPDSLPRPPKLDRGVEAAVHPFLASALDHLSPRNCVSGFPDLPDDDKTVATLRALYFGLASEVDHHIGRVIGALKQAGQYDDTLIVLTSDHGEMLGDRHAWGKMSVYDAAYHVPLIVRDPRNPAQFGTRVTTPTQSIDVAPTILDWVGNPVPSSMDGQSLVPFLEGETPPDWSDITMSELDFGDPVTPTIWQRQHGLAANVCNVAILRKGDLTLAHFNAGWPPLLFDHGAQGEFRNIAGDPDAAPVLLEMTQALLSHRMTRAEGTFANTMITPKGPVFVGRPVH
jgi:arylsulfatase A-like enzyme